MVKNNFVKASEWEWQINEGLRYAQLVYLIITTAFRQENIFELLLEEDAYDDYRIDSPGCPYPRDEEGCSRWCVDLMGCTPWGCIDLVSAGNGRNAQASRIYLCRQG